MANNLGRDQLSWTPDIWADIDKAVLAEVGSIRVVQKVFNSTHVPNATNVPADQLDEDAMTIDEGATKPLIEISVEFSLTQGQVDNEATLHTGRTLAMLAGKTIASVEDALLLQGTNHPKLAKNVSVVNENSAEHGLFGVASGPAISVKPLPSTSGTPTVYGGNLFAAVTQGMGHLTQNGQPGPYALILESSVYADAFSPMASTLATTADRLTPLLTGGFYGTGAMPARTGLLTSLGGQPTTIYVAQDPTTAYTQENKDGSHLFRVFERVQFVARHKTAFVNLAFKAAAAAAKR